MLVSFLDICNQCRVTLYIKPCIIFTAGFCRFDAKRYYHSKPLLNNKKSDKSDNVYVRNRTSHGLFSYEETFLYKRLTSIAFKFLAQLWLPINQSGLIKVTDWLHAVPASGCLTVSDCFRPRGETYALIVYCSFTSAVRLFQRPCLKVWYT